MTSELFINLVLLLSALLTLDYLLLRARRESTRLAVIIHTIQSLWKRLSDWSMDQWTLLRKTQALPIENQRTVESETTAQPQAIPSGVMREISTFEHESTNSAGNVARVHIDAEVPPRTVLHITIFTDSQGQAHIEQNYTAASRARQRLPFPSPGSALHTLFATPIKKLAGSFLSLALLIYLLTRLIGLTDFPIYFFGDEAIQATSASDLLERGMRGPDGTLLPTYFQNGQYFNLSLSVYLQLLPQLLFEKSIFITRATSVLVTVLAAACVGLMMQNFLGASKRGWLATLLLSVTPAWFLHSRTAFETALFVSFYAVFLYFYLEYRLRNPKRVYWAVLFAGLAFYSYSPGQLVLAVTGMFLFLSDLRYHWQQRKILLLAAGLLAIFALPYLRFRLASDYSPLDHLRSLGSYWVQPLPLTEKVMRFLLEYLHGLSPAYWFLDSTDMVRHQMRGYGNLPLWFAPLMAAGIVHAILQSRHSPAHRLVLLAALAAPSGAALAEIGITRILVFVIPASLLATLGLEWMLAELGNLIRRIWKSPGIDNVLTRLAFLLLVSVNFSMLLDSLKNGPTWYTDYGLYGMQYGAKQIYQETVVPALQQDSQAKFIITPSWANGAEHFVSFFVPRALQPRVSIGQIYDFLRPPRQFTAKDYFVVTDLEFQKIRTDPKFKTVVVRSTIPYPNGETGFYLINIQLQENIEEILAAEEQTRRAPVETTIEWMGQTVRVRHSQFGGGRLQDVIDGDVYTLAKGEQANPIFYEFFFSQPVSAKELVLTTGSMRDFDVIVRVYPVESESPVEYRNNYLDLPDDPTVNIPFLNGPAQFDHIFISIKDNNQGEIAQVHVREITFK